MRTDASFIASCKHLLAARASKARAHTVALCFHYKVETGKTLGVQTCPKLPDPRSRTLVPSDKTS